MKSNMKCLMKKAKNWKKMFEAEKQQQRRYETAGEWR